MQTDYHPKADVDRVANCRAAIEPSVRYHLSQSANPFTDADHLIETIFAELGKDGWSHGEIGVAIYQIAADQ